MKNTMTMQHGTYRLYRRRADGELTLIGDVNYAYPSPACGTFDPSDEARRLELAERDAYDQEVNRRLCEMFEELVDNSDASVDNSIETEG